MNEITHRKVSPLLGPSSRLGFQSTSDLLWPPWPIYTTGELSLSWQVQLVPKKPGWLKFSLTVDMVIIIVVVMVVMVIRTDRTTRTHGTNKTDRITRTHGTHKTDRITRTRDRQDRQVRDERQDRQIWHLNLTFQVTCVGQLPQFLRCF